MKLKIDKEQIGSLSEHWKGFVITDGEESYLDLEQGDAGLKSALAKTKEERNLLRQEKEKLVTDNSDLVLKYQEALKNTDNTVSKENYEALESSYKSQVEKIKSEYEEQVKGLSSNLQGLLIDNQAKEIAHSFKSLAPEWIELEAKQRMKLEQTTDGKQVVRYLDAKGEVTALDKQAFIESLKAEEKFKGVIIASNANGGDANGGESAGGTKTFAEMDGNERALLNKTNPAKFAQLKEAHFANN